MFTSRVSQSRVSLVKQKKNNKAKERKLDRIIRHLQKITIQ